MENNKYIGALVHGWPNTRYFGVVIGIDEALQRYIVHWLNWANHDGRSVELWSARIGADGPFALESNIIV